MSRKKRFEYFMTIVEEKSISKAAAKLYISQPSLSKFLIKLEGELGVTLFTRTSNVLSLTPAGEIYIRYIEDVEMLAKKLQNTFAKLQDNSAEPMKLGIAPWNGSLLSAKIMSQFTSSFPYVKFEIVEDHGLTLAKLLRTDKLDFLIGYKEALLTGDFLSTPLLSDKLLLVVPKSYTPSTIHVPKNNSFTNPIHTDIGIFNHCKIITAKKNQLLYIRINNLIDKYNLSPSSLIESSNMATRIRLVNSGQGITFIPAAAFYNELNMDNLVFFDIDDVLCDWTWFLFYKKQPTSPPAKGLLTIIKKLCLELNFIKTP